MGFANNNKTHFYYFYKYLILLFFYHNTFHIILYEKNIKKNLECVYNCLFT